MISFRFDGGFKLFYFSIFFVSAVFWFAVANSASAFEMLFQGRADFLVGIEPEGVAAADFNGDGKIDLATANNQSTDISILLGNGDGAFSEPTDYMVNDRPF